MQANHAGRAQAGGDQPGREPWVKVQRSVLLLHAVAFMISAILAACSEEKGRADERGGSRPELPNAVVEAACAPPSQLGSDWQVRLAGLQLTTPPRECPRGEREDFVVDAFTWPNIDEVEIGSLPSPDDFVLDGKAVQEDELAGSALTRYVVGRMSPVNPRALSDDGVAPIGGCMNGRCKMAFRTGDFIVQVAWHAPLYGTDLKQVAYNLDCLFETRSWCDG
jgi:hypothetical protein